MPLAPGDVFAGYTIVRTLGTGGMGAVYLVRHPRLPRHDALKLLQPQLSSDPSFAARFMREADLVARLSHPNIVSVFDRGTEAGQLWLTMQYVDGHDAEESLDLAGGLLPPHRALHILTGVAAALDAAHRERLVHRDVKPANILLQPGVADEPERVFLTDFGLAKSLEAHTKLTMTGAVVATFDYASPEQIESRPLDARSDVYSLGCVLVKLLTGTVPYPGHTVAAALHGHLSLPPPRPTERTPWLPPAVDQVVARAMAKDPADRYPSCRALAAATAAAIDAFPPAPPLPYTIVLTQDDRNGGPSRAITTDRLPRETTDRLVDLVRRTRFFDLPDDLVPLGGDTAQARAGAGAGRRVTIEIRSGHRVRRVRADLGRAHRPPELDVLVTTVEELLRTGVPPVGAAPPTVPSLPEQRRFDPAVPSLPDGARPDFRRPPRPLPSGVHTDPQWRQAPLPVPAQGDGGSAAAGRTNSRVGHRVPPPEPYGPRAPAVRSTPPEPAVGGPRRFAPDPGSYGSATPGASARPPARRKPWWRRPLLLITGTVLAAVLTVLAVFVLPGNGDDPDDGDTTAASRTPETITLAVDGTQMWTDAGVDVRAGDRIAVTASGQVFHNERDSIGPEGFRNEPHLSTPFSELNHAALIGRIGENGSGFHLGESATITAEADGRLYLGINDGGLENNRGYWDATVAVEPHRG